MGKHIETFDVSYVRLGESPLSCITHNKAWNIYAIRHTKPNLATVASFLEREKTKGPSSCVKNVPMFIYSHCGSNAVKERKTLNAICQKKRITIRHTCSTILPNLVCLMHAKLFEWWYFRVLQVLIQIHPFDRDIMKIFCSWNLFVCWQVIRLIQLSIACNFFLYFDRMLSLTLHAVCTLP